MVSSVENEEEILILGAVMSMSVKIHIYFSF
jgi:hypothetical protein